MKVILTFETDEAPKIEINYGTIKQKGYFDPLDGPDILQDVYQEMFSGKKDLSGNKKRRRMIGWNIFKNNIIASDIKTESVIVKIPAQRYYMPFTIAANKTVFKVNLPNIIGVKKHNWVGLFCTNEDFENINLNTEIYPLEIPHVYSDGSVCLGSFNARIDFNYPEKYFIELISYPNAHKQEVEKLREIEKNGYKITNYQRKIKLNNML